jgi:phosphoribosylformylglycinamidine synthase
VTRIGVVIFPGSNCEYDASLAMTQLGADVDYVWHSATDLMGFDGIILPGGFAHGDYLRPGALARFSPVMEAVARFASAGGPVLGICNGFQVLTEAGLLPGALQKNRGLTFLSEPVGLVVDSTKSVLTHLSTTGQALTIPINHFSGAYSNPNGSRADIAGVANEAGNVVGLMPHPERAMSTLLGSEDGRVLLAGFVSAPRVLEASAANAAAL